MKCYRDCKQIPLERAGHFPICIRGKKGCLVLQTCLSFSSCFLLFSLLSSNLQSFFPPAHLFTLSLRHLLFHFSPQSTDGLARRDWVAPKEPTLNEELYKWLPNDRTRLRFQIKELSWQVCSWQEMPK